MRVFLLGLVIALSGLAYSSGHLIVVEIVTDSDDWHHIGEGLHGLMVTLVGMFLMRVGAYLVGGDTT